MAKGKSKPFWLVCWKKDCAGDRGRNRSPFLAPSRGGPVVGGYEILLTSQSFSRMAVLLRLLLGPGRPGRTFPFRLRLGWASLFGPRGVPHSRRSCLFALRLEVRCLQRFWQRGRAVDADLQRGAHF